MAATDTDLFKDKIEVSLDGRQIFYLFFGGAVVATLVFVLGVMVGRRVEARAVVETGSPVTDPLAALDRMEGSAGLAFPSALRGDDQVMLGAVDATFAKRSKALKPGTGGPVTKSTLSASQVANEGTAKEEQSPAPKAAAEANEEKTKPAAAPTKAAPTSAVPAAPAKEVPALDKPEAKPAKRRFTLQVGSFQDKSEADNFFRGLAVTKYEPYMVEADVPGKGTYYRVRVGGYASFDEAVEAKTNFEESQHVIAYVTRLK